jgi:predicted dehydrogenase
MVRELRHLIKSGAIGEVQQIFIEMPQEGFGRKSSSGAAIIPQKWRLRDEYIPTVSFDLGSHIHMLVSFLTGERPSELVAIQTSRGNFPQVIDGVQCIARYSSNLDVNICYGKTLHGCRNGLHIRVFGKQGAIEWFQENPELLNCADDKGLRYCIDRTSEKISIACQPRYQRFKGGHPAGFIEAFANYYYDLADALERFITFGEYAHNPYVFGIEESLEGLRMLECISRSSKSKAWEAV